MEYSTWNKWDLHIHTRASNIKCKNDYAGAGDQFTKEECKEFRDSILEKKVKLIAVTDHYYFHAEQFIVIKKLFKEVQGNALPGVELKVFYYLNENAEVEYPFAEDRSNLKPSKPIHCILIFNDDSVSDNDKFYFDIQEVINKLYKDKDCVFICDVTEAFLNIGYEFVLIPHFEKHNDLEKAIKDRNGATTLDKNMALKTKWLVGGFFSGLDGNVCKIKQSKIRAISYLNDNYEYDLPAILTSDNHDYNKYIEDVSEYKALPSFNGLKLCFSDPAQRIREQKTDIEKKDAISCIRIRPNDSSKMKACDIQISPYLNCIIGGRSSGKSLLTAMIGKTIGERTNNHIDQNQRSEYEKFLDRYKTYFNNISIELLRPDESLYDGKLDIFLQDSIIRRFEASDSSLLAQDFKDEFNENEFDNINNIKEDIINDIKKFIILLDSLSTQYNSLKSMGNISSKFDLPLIDEGFVFYTDISEEKYQSLITDARNLKSLNESVTNASQEHKQVISKYPNINQKFKDLLDEITAERKSITNYAKKYHTFLSKIIEIKVSFNSQKNEAIMQYDLNRKGVLNLIKEIVVYLKTYRELIDLIEKLNKVNEDSKSSENIVGDYKFVVKYTSKVTSSIILKILGGFRLSSIVSETLMDFLKTYVVDEKKWSYNRNSELIKSKIEEEINNYIKKEYQIYEGNELINEMSEGRKASVFIDILLKKDQNQYPIIIDQPEDNMDNQDISKRLVDSLRKRKNNRQIFVVTHNPNVLVNGDAENVIIANKNNDNIITYQNSAIEYNDSFDMIKKICRLVEGGTNAFLKREKKYGLEVTSAANYGGQDD